VAAGGLNTSLNNFSILNPSHRSCGQTVLDLNCVTPRQPELLDVLVVLRSNHISIRRNFLKRLSEIS
jgi:hypothetical protein